jgi:5-deoxy-glucuronate isomerase
MSYLYPAHPVAEGFTPVVAAPQSDLRFLAMGRLLLSAEGATYATHTRADEMVLDVLGGICELKLEGQWGRARYGGVGQRANPFAGPPGMVYIPRDTDVTITCLGAPLSAVIVRAPSRRDTAPALVSAGDVPSEAFGRDNWQRCVYPCIGVNVDADRIVMGETHVPSGNWGSYPPHKHDQDKPPEVISEEIYHFLIDPPHGFGVQSLWTAPGDAQPISDAYLLRNGDTVAIPRGYHPTAVAPGFRMITVWAFAGESRGWGTWVADPTYAGLLAV